MRIPRLHVDTTLSAGQALILGDSAARHVARVLRLRPGAEVKLFDGRGAESDARLGEVSAAKVVVEPIGTIRRLKAPALNITLAQSVVRGDKMDWTVQKATELGVAAIAPLLTARCEVRLDTAKAAKRLAHWRAIAVSACEQSGRVWLPEIAPVAALAEWAEISSLACSARLTLVPDAPLRLRESHMESDKVAIAIGPEGGLDEADLALLDQAGFSRVRLGPRILRTETAGIAAIACLQALHGDF